MNDSRLGLDTDRDLVVEVLRGGGPRSLSHLRELPAFAGWPSERVELAVVQAWSDSLLSVDADDQLIAL